MSPSEKPKREKPWGTLGPRLAALSKAAGLDRCMICLRPLARVRKHNRRMCGRASCRYEYKRLHKLDDVGVKSIPVVQALPGSTSGRVLEIFACGHRAIRWRNRSGAPLRACKLCAAGASKRAKPLDFTILST